jgi:hypothetical protein
MSIYASKLSASKNLFISWSYTAMTKAYTTIESGVLAQVRHNIDLQKGILAEWSRSKGCELTLVGRSTKSMVQFPVVVKVSTMPEFDILAVF